jgi:hypothetical protein
MIVPATDSPWFYGKDIPQSIFHPIFGTEIFLGRLYYAEEATPSYDFSQVSFSPELGGTLWGVDFSILYYYGFDNDLLLEAEFENHDTDPYDIKLTPLYRKIHALGLNLATNISALRMWGDAAFTFNKPFLANIVSWSKPTTPVVDSSLVEYTLGCSYEFPFLDLKAFAEFRNSHLINPSEYIVEPALRSVVATALSIAFFQGRLSAYALFAYSIAEPSGTAVLRISFTPFTELTVRLLAPVFFGPPTTEFGQYSRNHFVSAEVAWGY